MPGSVSFKQNVDALIAAVIGLLLIQLFTRHGGIGVSPDSIMYTGTARNLNAGRGMLGFDNKPMVLFPVFYPLFLGAVMFFSKTDVLVFAPYLNGILFALVIYLTGCIIQRFSSVNRIYKIIVLLVIVCSPCLTDVYSMLWSETLFICWIIIFFHLMHRYLNKPTLTNLIIVSIIVALNCITRYAGITLVATGGLLIVGTASLPFSKKITHLIIFGITGISLLVINLIRNELSSGLLTGQRQRGIISLYENISYFGTVLSEWLPFSSVSKHFSFLLGLIFLLGAIAVFCFHLYHKVRFTSYENIIISFFLVFGWFMVISATISRYEPINSRLLSPLYIPFICISSLGLHKLIRVRWNKMYKYSSLFLISVIVVSMLTQEINIDRSVYKDESEGGIGGYTEDGWKESKTIQFLKNDSLFCRTDMPIFSNANHAVYFLAGKSVLSLPERVHIQEVHKLFQLKMFKVIWFNADENPDLINLNELKQKKTLVLLKTFNDGMLYLCTGDTIVNH